MAKPRPLTERLIQAINDADARGEIDEAVAEAVLAEIAKTPAIRARLDAVSDAIDSGRNDDADRMLAELRLDGVHDSDVDYYETVLMLRREREGDFG